MNNDIITIKTDVILIDENGEEIEIKSFEPEYAEIWV